MLIGITLSINTEHSVIRCQDRDRIDEDAFLNHDHSAEELTTPASSIDHPQLDDAG